MKTADNKPVNIQMSDAQKPTAPGGQAWPRITLVTPSYNQGRYIEKTIASVLAQGYPDLEYFVVDGGSKDNTVDILKRHTADIDWWVSEPDRGQSHAINKGLDKSSGTLLGWLNSDDYLTPGALFKLAEAYLQDTSVGAVYGQGHLVDEHDKVIYTPELQQVTHDSLFDWCFGADFMQPSCLFTRQAWEDSGAIEETLNFTLDVEYWMRLSQKYRFRMIPDVLSVSLSHPDAKTTSMRNYSHAELAIVCMRYGQEKAARKILKHLLERTEREKAKAIADSGPGLGRRLKRKLGNLLPARAR